MVEVDLFAVAKGAEEGVAVVPLEVAPTDPHREVQGRRSRVEIIIVRQNAQHCNMFSERQSFV